MLKLYENGVYLKNGHIVDKEEISNPTEAYKGTIAYGIISSHNTLAETQKGSPVKIMFDALASHDITYVGIIQTARASGLTKFPIPYVLTNCHNSLCAVGGTINEDDHVFGLSACKKYGGIYVPAHMAVIHSYMREMMSGCGRMILGSDSHTRYGALGTMAIGEGGPELVKQLLNKTYDIDYPEVVGVKFIGSISHGVGPHDVALSIIGATFNNGFVKNRVMEFFGDINNLSVEFRNGIDVMTTETACLSSIWATDEKTEEYFAIHGRAEAYKRLNAKNEVYYDRYIEIDLSKIVPMIAMPFHPSNVYKLKDVINNPYDILKQVSENGNKLLNNPKVKMDLLPMLKDGKINVSQAVIAGCAGGTYDNIYTASKILSGKSVGTLSASIYPGSQPAFVDLIKKGAIEKLMLSGAVVKTAFCGPCFGAGDVPSNNGFSIRHTTRNFEMREGAKIGEGQLAYVALMDARSIAATMAKRGVLTSAEDVYYDENIPKYNFDGDVYKNKVYFGLGKENAKEELVLGPNITDWPEQYPLGENLILELAATIYDPVTTTDELIPSGETSSYRSNPKRLSEFTLSRKCPDYVASSKKIAQAEQLRREGKTEEKYAQALKLAGASGGFSIGSAIFAVKPGDGSAREQAASCQRVLGGSANIAREYATKRYRSNLINWGMLPLINKDFEFKKGDLIVIKNPKNKLDGKTFSAKIIRQNDIYETEFSVGALTQSEKDIIKKGCLINYYKS